MVGASCEASSVPGSAGGRPPHAGRLQPPKLGAGDGGRRGRGGRSLASSPILLDALGVCSLEAGDAGAADRGAAAVVLVIGGDVADRGVQPDAVVLALDAGELGVERGRIADLAQVPPVALQMAEE